MTKVVDRPRMNSTDKNNANNSDRKHSFGERIKAKWNTIIERYVKDIEDNRKW